MQQTNQYQFHLIEAMDTFSPVPLNENTQKTEALLSALNSGYTQADSALRSEIQSAAAELNQKHSVLEASVAKLGNAKMVAGSYQGSNTFGSAAPNVLSFPFQPSFVVCISNGLTLFAVYGQPSCNCIQGNAGTTGSSSGTYTWTSSCTWGENTLSWYSVSDAHHQFNSNSRTYFYMAFGE